MSIFEEKVEEYKEKLLTEQPVEDPNAAAGAAPPPDPSMAADPAAAQPPPEEEINISDAIDQIYEDSKKPWVELANILARSMFHNFDDDQIQQINSRISENGDVTVNVEDFRDYMDNEAKGIKDELDPHNTAVEGASIRVFEIVKDVMDQTNPGTEVVRADDR